MLTTWPIRFQHERDVAWVVFPAYVDLLLAPGNEFLFLKRGQELAKNRLTRNGEWLIRQIFYGFADVVAIALCERRHFKNPEDWCVIGLKLAQDSMITPQSGRETDLAWDVAQLIGRGIYRGAPVDVVSCGLGKEDVFRNCPTCGKCWEQKSL